ncbi:MFS general substrate transporter [Earliella scabrosa]|nr:MFS general substrate transporter [Earliella scabrosa]
MEVELSTLQPRSQHQGEASSATATPKETSRKSLEMIETGAVEGPQSSDAPETAVSASTPETRRKARIQYAACCYVLFLAGWNDGTTGPLLPRLQQVYQVNFALVSLIFVLNCIGFIVGAAANPWLFDRFGFGKVLLIGAFAQIVGYVLEAVAPPFPVFVLGYAANGFGIALQDAGANAYVASLKDNAAAKMGILHAIYGLGALSAPLVATQFSQLKNWSFHYIVSLGISVTNAIILFAVFRFKDQDTCLAEIGQLVVHDANAETNESSSKYKAMFRQRAMHLMAFFILVYVGVEVTLGGWIVTYVIDLRGGGPSSGYIASGFFGGLTFGRIALLWVNHKLGERRALFLYGVLAIGLELVVWLVPSLIGGAVAVSLVGVLLGPMYPMVMNHAGRVLPTRLLTGSIGWIAGFGQAGSAFLPFLTGALASKTGIKSLQPLLVSMMSFMIVLWALVPNKPRRIE